MPLNAVEQDYFQVLRKQAAGKEDLHSLNLLDIAEQLPEHERNVIVSVVSSRVKHEIVSLAICTAMGSVAARVMSTLMNLGLVRKKES